jgi:uncharacterized protein DUF4189
MTLRRACTRTLVAGALLVLSITVTQAAGALAVGTCGAYGFAIDYSGPDQAQTAALRKCSGKGCAVVASMRRNCAALAIDGRNACGPFGYAAKARLGEAQNTALRQCYSHGGKECVIRAFVCDAKG